MPMEIFKEMAYNLRSQTDIDSYESFITSAQKGIFLFGCYGLSQFGDCRRMPFFDAIWLLLRKIITSTGSRCQYMADANRGGGELWAKQDA
jgi:hypothetical protein